MDSHPHNPTFLISALGVSDSLFSRCPSAQTLVAISQRHQRLIFCLLPCQTWGCRPCSNNKVRRIAYRVNLAKPNRLLTLTVDPALYSDPRHAFDETRRKVPDLIKALRPRFGEVEYLRVTELTATGYPHYHLLVRSGYLPHCVVRDRWSQLTGASIVDLRQIHNRFRTYTYLVKYLAKMHNLGWSTRHMSYSRNFFPPEDEKPPPLDDLSERKIDNLHPSHYLRLQYPDDSIEVLSPGVFALMRPEPPFAPDSAHELTNDF